MPGSKPVDRSRTTVDVDYSQYHVLVDGIPLYDLPEGEMATGLIDRLAEQLTVFTGRHHGRVTLQLETWAVEPDLDLDLWDDVVDTELVTTTGHISVDDLFGQSEQAHPNIAGFGPGTYRLRVSARGRDAAQRTRKAERHRLQCWPVPAPGAPLTRVLKLTDLVGRHMRGEDPPPVLQPWEILGARAMHDFLAVISTPLGAGGDTTPDTTTLHRQPRVRAAQGQAVPPFQRDRRHRRQRRRRYPRRRGGDRVQRLRRAGRRHPRHFEQPVAYFVTADAGPPTGCSGASTSYGRGH